MENKPTIPLEKVKATIEAALNDAQVEVRDLTGGGDHLEAIVISPDFEGKSPVDRHRTIYAVLQQELSTETIHALALTTRTPEEWAARR